MRKNQYVRLVALLLVALFMLTACGTPENNPDVVIADPSAQGEQPGSEVGGEGSDVVEDPFADVDWPVTLSVWTSNTGNGGEFLTSAAAAFNASQSRFIVDLSYAGSYSEVLAKMAASKAGSRPDMFSADTEGAYTYYENAEIYVPIQKHIDEDAYNMDGVVQNLRSAYTNLEGEWQCMPLGNTVTGFFYNAELLQKAGVDPRTDLNSYQEILAACEKLKSAGVKTPFFMHTSSGFYTFPMTSQGIQYVDNNNGKDGVPTRSLINEGACRDATIDFFQFLKDSSSKGLMVPFGTTVADAQSAFVNGECAIMCSFISSFSTVNNQVNGKFEFGYHEAPTITAGVPNVGQCVGGGVLFLANNNNPVKEHGAWEFMQFLMKDENTSAFAQATGYLPTTQGGFETADYQAFVESIFPTARYSIEAQQKTPETCYNAWLPMFNDFHALCKEYYTMACNTSTSAEDITARFAAAVDEVIDLYWMSTGQAKPAA